MWFILSVLCCPNTILNILFKTHFINFTLRIWEGAVFMMTVKVRSHIYLVSGFVRLLQPDTPLIILFDAHSAAVRNTLAHPAEELLQVLTQCRVLSGCLGVTRACH